jgi:cell division protein FtsI (penicillin-binding protein 3)
MSPRPSRARAAASHRIRVLLTVTVVVIGLMGARATFLGVVRADELSEQARNAQRHPTVLPAIRGAILSSDHKQFATDQLTATISASPDIIADPAGMARTLGPILDLPVAELTTKLTGKSQYVLLKHNVDQRHARQIRELKLTGIFFDDTYTRYFPRQDAAQVVGLVKSDGTGQTGIELQRDKDLSGTPGSRLDARDALNRTVDEISKTDPVPGKNVTLTIDAAIQEKTRQILQDVVDANKAKSASAIVMNPKDGSILVMTTVPTFDPNDRRTTTPEVTRNAPTSSLYEPGSTFKVIAVAGALEQQVVTPMTSFRLEPTVTLFGGTPSQQTLHESHRDFPVTLNVSEIIAQSSNVGTYTIANKLGPPGVQRWIHAFGFGSQTGIDFPGEEAGLVREEKDWSGTSILTIPIGQGISVTLAQMARAYAAIANGGELVTPHLVGDVGGVAPAVAPPKRILSPETAAQMNEMLKRVVDSESGTGTEAQVPGFDVAGKTGTSRIRNPETGKYDDRYVASFIGYLPADDPQLLIAVAVDEPSNGLIYGGDVAAPAFEKIATFALPQLGITP